VFIYFFLHLIARIHPDNFHKNRKYIFISIASTLAAITLFYFLNIIPPIPLSMKEKVIAYDIERLSGGDYRVLEADYKWYEDLFGKRTAYISNNSPVYVFSSVFAPTKLNTDIVHEWQVKTEDGWQTASRIDFPIEGGADQGYRGYSVKYNLYPGLWRVNIETERGQTIGRIKFKVETADFLPEVKERIY